VQALIGAAQSARDSVAIEAALTYLNLAHNLMNMQQWPMGEFRIGSNVLKVQCLVLSAQHETASALVDEVLSHLHFPLKQVMLYQLKIELLCLQSNYHKAMRIARNALGILGIHTPDPIGPDDLQAQWSDVSVYLSHSGINAMVDLPVMSDTSIEAVVSLLASMIEPASFIDPDIWFFQQYHLIKLSLRHGITSAGTQGLAWFGVAIAHRYGLYAQGFQLVDVALRLVDRHDYVEARTSVLVALDQVSIWTQPISYALERARDGFSTSFTEGRLTMSSYACLHIIFDLLTAGVPLSAVHEQIGLALSFSKRI
jgi:predicted ATPase